MLIAGVSIAVLVFGVGGWAATSNLSGAFVGAGTVVVEGNVKRIQHRDGGIVGEIRVRDGQQVKAGELLVRPDDTVTRANLTVIAKQIDRSQARAIRLTAERDEAQEPAPPKALEARLGDPEVAAYVNAEKALFHARKRTIDGQKAQLRQRVHQLAQEADGLKVRRDAKDDELRLIDEELAGITSLHAQGPALFSRLAELKPMKAQLSGERGQLTAEIARAATQTTETELQVLQLDQDRRSEVLTELRDVDNKLAELTEQRVTAEDQLKRIDILSPQNGIVHELAVHTVRRRHRPRRNGDADCSRQRQPRRRGENAAGRYRSAASRAEGHLALLCLQPAHDAGDHRRSADDCR
ncbi:HlyD family secretion protein [Sinorhizobium terangae]|nr:HlyD family secretion protein [Sinorhizobium terangae]